uniref:LRR receptor-like serine/threonine-protein kinase FLS2 n=1 Tax=Erigeron canadensis TaxID=72917 RepID=UPI001CB90015|nr:LRR receptor-like serine/threonine-protein kinase FLS2 [Erigeron canadensis]
MALKISLVLIILLPYLVLGDHDLSIEIEAMKFFKDSITEDPTDALTDWNSGSTHHCNWFGIECDHFSRHVVSISLHGKKLKAEVSRFLGKLSSLKFLDLSQNSGNPSLCIKKTQLCTLSRSLKSLALEEKSPPNHSFQRTAAISGAVSCIAVFIILTFAFLICRVVRKKKLRDLESAKPEPYIPRLDYKRFYRKELEDATDNFSEGNVLGTGGLSTMYKGKLENGRMIVVKNFKFKQHSTVSVKSFQREMETLGKLRHKNLLKVLGYAWESERIKAMVLEYMENGNLDTFIHESTFDRSGWGLSKRVDILVSVASGLAYLHSGYDFPIIHCDLKPSNILLDERWNAHISDFGMARIIVGVHQQDGSCVSSASAFAGSIGYLAPEFSYMRKVTTKVDVFSFGIIMMESITGKRPTELTQQAGINLTLPQLVEQALSDGINGQLMIVDPNLAPGFRTNQVVIEQLLKLALSCTKIDPKLRPDMKEVMYFLSDITKKKVLNTKGTNWYISNHQV